MSTASTPRRASKPVRRRRGRGLFKGLGILAFVALCLLTLTTYAAMTRFEPARQGPVLDDADFAGLAAGATSAWERTGPADAITVRPGGILTLENPDPITTVGVKQTLPLTGGVRAFQFRADIALNGVSSGEAPWQRARVYLIGLDALGNADWSRPHKLLQTHGTSPSIPYSANFELGPDATSAQVALVLARASGSMTVQNVNLLPLVERPAYRLMATLTAAGWIVAAIIAVVVLLRRSRNRLSALLFALLVAGGAAVMLLPYEVRNPLVETAAATFGFDRHDETALRVLHACLLGLVAFLWRRALPQQHLITAIALNIGLAVGFEALQALGQDFGEDDALDIAANLAGVGVGLALAQALQGRGRSTTRRRGARRGSSRRRA